MSKVFRINNRSIGHEFSPYVIAEMSANHKGDINNAYKIIDMAKMAGADAIKMQTYTADTLTIDCEDDDFQLTDGLWSGRTLYNLYQEAYTPWEWHKPLFEYARKKEITIFSSPFDHSAVDFLEDLNAPAYKIASFETVDLSLIKYAAQTGKPLIISTGMADSEEIEEAITAAREGGARELALLHCVSGYPAPSQDYNLKTLQDMARRFNVPVGLSDHTLDNITAMTSVALGSCIIEKHVTLDQNGGGPDDTFSLEADGLTSLCTGLKTAWASLGRVDYGRKSSELGNVKFRRSLYFVKAIKAGEVVTAEHVRSIRPGYGLAPKYIDRVVGQIAPKDIARGVAVGREWL